MHDRTERRDAIFDVVRRALRARGMTYRELGQRLGLSESGVKKVFMTQNPSLDRLLEIAGVLEIEASELLAQAEAPEVERVTLGIDAQRWLLDHPWHFAWFWWLTTLRLHPRAIRERHGQTIAQMRRSLDALDERGLIALGPDDSVRLPSLLRWERGGPLIDALHASWGTRLVGDSRDGGWSRMNQLELTGALRRELEADLDALMDEYMRRARRARALTPDHAPVRVSMRVAPGAFDPEDLVSK